MATNDPPLRSVQEIINYTHSRALSAMKIAIVSSDGTQALPLPVTEDAVDTIYSNQLTVSAANSHNSMGADTTIKSALFKANGANTGEVYIGTSAVSGSNGYVLEAGDAVVMGVSQLSAVFYSLETADDGLSYIALN